MAPHWRAYEYNHVDQCRKSHRESCKKQALVAVAEHGWEQFGMHKIPQRRDESEEQEQAEIDNEQDGRDDVEPAGVVRYLVDYG